MYDPNDAFSRLLHHPTVPHDPYSQHPYPQASYSAHQHPYPQTSYTAYQNFRPAKKLGFFQKWFATSNSLRPTANRTEVKWGIHWLTPISIVFLLLLGTASAVGHHYFYSLLHHTTVGDEARQRWTLWIGSSFSFLTKVTLTAALGLARTQWVWLTLRNKWLTLEGIDALFGVTHDPRYFIHGNMVKRAKVATAIAVAMWMFPIAAILTPGAISVDTFIITDNIPCTVRSLSFPFDINSTAQLLSENDLAKELGFLPLGSWDEEEPPIPGTSVLVMRAFQLAAYTGHAATPGDLPPGRSTDITTLAKQCGENCAYTLEFLGPAVTCTNYTSWSTLSLKNITDWMGDAQYGAAWYSSDRNRFLVAIMPTDDATLATVLLQCQSSTARYTVQQRIQQRRFLEPRVTKVESVNLPGFHDNPIYPETTYLSHWSLMNAVFRVVQGQLVPGASVETPIALTPIYSDIYFNITNVGPAIERMSHKMIASLLTFGVVLNGTTTYALNVAAIQKTACQTTKPVVFYVYSTLTLVFIYGLTVACALVTSVAGFYALGQNGVASSTSVSTIIRTTRNTTLDELIVGGSCLGGDPIPKELKTVELQFGELQASEKRPSSFAMGVRGEILSIKQD